MRLTATWLALLALLTTVALITGVPVSSSCAGAAEASRYQTSPESRKISDAVSAAERSLGLQTEMPGVKKTGIKPERRETRSSGGWNISTDFARLALIAAGVVLLVVILLTIRDSMWSDNRSRRLTREEEAEIAPVATAARMDKAQSEADLLAGQQSFAEAMHLLLLQSFSELRRRLDVSIAVSLTSREILNRINLSFEARAAFSDIISRVEVSYFGSHLPGEEEYLACRRSFEALTIALQNDAIRMGYGRNAPEPGAPDQSARRKNGMGSPA